MTRQTFSASGAALEMGGAGAVTAGVADVLVSVLQPGKSCEPTIKRTPS